MDLLAAMAQLLLLNELSFTSDVVPAPPGAAFTALTASTNLCALKVRLGSIQESGGPLAQHAILFTPGTIYPHLRHVELQFIEQGQPTPVSEQQLQLAVHLLPNSGTSQIVVVPNPVPTHSPATSAAAVSTDSVLTAKPVRIQPRRMRLDTYNTGAAAAAAVVGIAAQLTQLKQLRLEGWLNTCQLKELKQLTALTALEQLNIVIGYDWGEYISHHLQNTVRLSVRVTGHCKIVRLPT
jgi:hypothetical protein